MRVWSGAITQPSSSAAAAGDHYGRTPEELQKLGPRYQLEITTVLPEPAAQHVLGCNNKLELEECHAALSRTLSALVSPLSPAPSPSADGLLRLDLLGVLAMGSMQKARLGLGIPLHPQPHLQPGSPPDPAP